MTNRVNAYIRIGTTMPIEYKTLLGIPDREIIELDDKSPTGLIPFFDNVRGVTGFDVVSD